MPLAHRYAGAPAQLPLDARARAAASPGSRTRAARKLGQNLKYDQHVLANHGIALAGVAHDTLLESYVLEVARAPRHGQPRRAPSRRRRPSPTTRSPARARADRLRPGGDRARHRVRGRGRRRHAAACTGRCTRRIAADAKLAYVYETIEMPAREVLFRMERNGVLIDAGAARSAEPRARASEMLELEQQAYQLAGQPFNLNSPKQIGEILFERAEAAGGEEDRQRRAVDRRGRAGSSSRSTIRCRSCCSSTARSRKLKSHLHRQAAAMVNPHTGRVHTNYAQAVGGDRAARRAPIPTCRTFRCAPPEGRRIREAFIAPPGSVHRLGRLLADRAAHHGAPLGRRGACCTPSPTGEDVHRATAAEIFGVRAGRGQRPSSAATPRSINFGLIYGMSAFGLARAARHRARRRAGLHRPLLRALSRRRELHGRTREQAREHGYVETVFGRRLWLPEINARRRGRGARAPSAPRSTRRCRAPPPT